jgi:NitT/TauT family transport system ATP-binding protein/taurine transport system ATP-binding protein
VTAGPNAGKASPGSGRVTLSGVSSTYQTRRGDVAALGTVDLDVEPGSFVALVGPSGCGKTTLLRLVAGFHEPSTGTVLVDGVPVNGPGSDRGVVFQAPNLFPWLSVRGNVELGPKLRGAGRAERRAIADEHLALVGLADAAERPPYELSGGMQQRCAIARVLANDPAIVLMDEPFGALDAITRERLQGEVLRIWRATGKTFLFVTHAVEEAVYLGSRVVVLGGRPGTVVLDVPVELPEARGDVRLTPEFAALRAEVTDAIGSERSAA